MEQVFEPLQEELLQTDAEAETKLPAENVSPEAEEDKPVLSSEEELTNLRNEVESLRAALAQKQQEQDRTLRELGEFHRLFPAVSLQTIPNSVWKQVEDGIPLSAAYALYEKQELQAQVHADEINRQNATRSAGKAGKHPSGEYFSPDEVRAMSQKQVHDNYAKIMDSMKHWR